MRSRASHPHPSHRLPAPAHGLAFAASAIAFWALSGIWFNASQLNDSWEQLVWAQSFEWGYWKHPPLTTWFMAAVQQAWGAQIWWPYILGATASALTLVFTVLLARRLLAPEAVAWVALLFTLNNGFTRRAQVFNHNSVLVAVIAALAWRLAVALSTGRRQDWAWVGGLAGLALLTKYQALMPIGMLGLLVLFFWRFADRPSGPMVTNHMTRMQGMFQPAWGSLSWAALITLAVLTPHLIWLWQNDGLPMRYADQSLNAQALAPWREAVSLFVLQFRNWLPAVIVLAIYGLVWRWRRGRASASGHALGNAAWWWALVWGPAWALVVMAVLGVNLQSHWGMQALQFLVLVLAAWAGARWGTPTAWAWGLWAIAQAVGLVLMAVEMTGLTRAQHPDVRKLPAHHIVGLAVEEWRSRTPCQLRRVEAPSHLGGMVLALAPREGDRRIPLVVSEDADPLKSPWAEPANVSSTGVLRLHMGEHPPAPQWQAIWSPAQDWPQFKVWAEVIAPEQPCGIAGQ